MKYEVLPLGDGIGKVELMDYLGDDITVVNAARVSMNKESDYLEYPVDMDKATAVMKDEDERLIRYLAKHNHWTPFSHPQITLRIKMPIFIARQWFKHMIGFTRNEVSRRYVDTPPEVYIPKSLRARADNVKQGSSDAEVAMHSLAFMVLRNASADAEESYLELVNKYNVCPEQARMVLPQSMYTEFVETGSLAAYARLANLRLDPHAQKEVRQYAEAVTSIMRPLFPVSWEALTDGD